ncbi:MAG: hypothetical protein M1133_02795 [Armatimonadetes bacterium]|nr:hypothetical protein [Armatimonadota bacterium]
MRGIDYLIDDTGKRKAVMIDLGAWGKLWEDFQDVLVSEARKDEPSIPWETLKAELEQENAQPA